MVRCLRLAITFGVIAATASFAANSWASQERITSFVIQVVVRPDATIAVTENIAVLSAGRLIKRGIVRDFPTRYRDAQGNFYRVGFAVQDVLQDGMHATYSVEDYLNGKRIRIGDAGRMLSHGVHTYIISYETNRQLGFFDPFDELYWNAIGTGWDFAIDHVAVVITLPQTVPADKINAEAYTGAFGAKESAYVVHKKENQIFFETTKSLAPHEGLTIVVNWPKGFVTPPGRLLRWWWWMRDNVARFLMLLALLLSILYYLFVLRYLRGLIKIGTVIPLFYPPRELSPGSLRYLLKKRYENKAFAAEIVAMAVKGYLAIQSEKTRILLMAGSLYTLKKKVEPAAVDHFYRPMFAKLFTSESIAITPQNKVAIEHAQEHLMKQYDRTLKAPYIRFNTQFFVGGVTLSLILGLAAFMLAPVTDFYLLIGSFVLFVINLIFGSCLPGYSQEGQQLIEEIEGFKLFLGTTETERLKLIGTPPDRTPELYEHYLPYAIALDVEEQWSAQFAPIFERLAAAGHPYTPVWYMGPGPFSPAFGSQLGTTMNQAITTAMPPAIASSKTPPGSSSGSGGGGYSGGGGGGGGGSGW